MLQRKLLFPTPSFIFSEATTKPSHQDLELSFPIAPAGLESRTPPRPLFLVPDPHRRHRFRTATRRGRGSIPGPQDGAFQLAC